MSIADVVAGKRDWHIECRDALTVLRTLPDECVQTCVTSPPYYALRNYGIDGQIGLEKTPELYVQRLVEVFREVRRVLRKDGTIWVNLGDSYAGSGKGVWDNPTSKAKEVYVPSASDYATIPKTPAGLKPKDLIGIPWMVAFALRADGWYLRSDIVWAKSNPMPESVTDRPTKSHEYIFLLSKSQRYYYDHEAIKEPAVNGDPNQPRGSVGVIDNPLNGGRRNQDEVGKRQYTGFNSRYSRRLAELAVTRTGGLISGGTEKSTLGVSAIEKRNKRDVWTVATHPYPGSHFATFPPTLIEPCILAGAPEGGIVLDPFSGAGTTGMVALRHGRRFIGIELKSEYVEMGRNRIIDDAPLLNAQEAHP